MSVWRAKALEMLPELAKEIAAVDNPMWAWIEICFAFQDAYKEPRNEDLIRHIYGYADWCLEHGHRDKDAERDLLTCVAVCFYESIPNHKASREDMPRWFSLEEVLAMKETFSYHLNPDEFDLLIKLFETAAPERPAKRGARARRRAKRTQEGK